MSYEVVLTDRAVADFDANLAYCKRHSSELAERWCVAVERAIVLLESDPQRFAAASESQRLQLDLRQINFGIGRRLTHRLVFAIRPDRVVVHTVRGLMQDDLTIDDLH